MKKLFTGLKELRPRARKNKSGRIGSGTAGERVDSSNSLPRPESHVAASDHDGEGSGTDTPARSRGRSPQPESIAADRKNNDRQRTETSVCGKEIVKVHSALNPEIVVVADSEPSLEAEQVHPPLSITSLPHTEKPDST